MYEASEPKTKAVVSKSEMARMVGLSRAVSTSLLARRSLAAVRRQHRRPFYDEELQKVLPRSPSPQLWHRRQAGAVLLAAAGRPRRVSGKPNKAKPPKDDARRSARRAEGPRAPT